MRIFLKIISWIWISIIFIANIPRLMNYNLSSSDGIGGLLGSLFAIGLLISPALWFLVKKKKVKPANIDSMNTIMQNKIEGTK